MKGVGVESKCCPHTIEYFLYILSMPIDLKNLSIDELIQLYPDLIEELKRRDIIRTKNIVGELGEYYAVKIFNETANLPKLQLAPPSTAHVDAISVRGKRYAIKSTSGSGTGIFASINIDDTDSKFEFLLVLRWDSYRVKSLLQFTWNQFVEFRKIKNPEGKYNFPLNNSVVRNAKVIYEK